MLNEALDNDDLPDSMMEEHAQPPAEKYESSAPISPSRMEKVTLTMDKPIHRKYVDIKWQPKESLLSWFI